ncbi:MAG TPA: NAD(P)H-binding protein [Solirubrobacterales bacterium]|nr:NAD(P)H-binding protein [Solirubrobacterales bacterium]
MILITGATGAIGTALLRELLAEGREVRAMVRDPRGLGANRVRVQLSMADLADPRGLRHAVRGADTVIHLAAAIRDQPPKRLEEINGLGTYRLLRAAEDAGVRRFIFFSAIGASLHQRTRFFRSKALAEAMVADAEIETTVMAPSIVYDRDDPWVTLMRRFALLPAMPISGSGRATFQPVWARDVARATIAAIDGEPGRYELAGPERLTYNQIARAIARSAGRDGPLLHVPLPMVRSGLIWLRRFAGERVFATWEEAELLEVPMVAEEGPADMRRLGVDPVAIRSVLGSG